MRRRLDLAAALVHRPPVLFLDEPTTGLDPGGRRDLWALIGELVADGTTVLLTTQYLEEADRLADNIVVVDHGRIIAEGTAIVPQSLAIREPTLDDVFLQLTGHRAGAIPEEPAPQAAGAGRPSQGSAS